MIYLDKMLVRILMDEIDNQCEMVKIAVDGINRFHNEDSIATKYLWFNVQGLLIATANISKILWNYDRKEIEEVKYLKEVLSLDDASKVKSRFFRNLFEHYDDHLINWSAATDTKIIATSNVMPKGMNIGVPVKNTFKTYYSDVNSIAFQGKEYSLQPVIKEVARIKLCISNFDKSKLFD